MALNTKPSPRRARAVWAPSAEDARREIRRTKLRRYRRHRRRALAVVLALALAAGAAAFHFAFDIVSVRGTGMSPTLQTGEWVLCIRQSLLDGLRGLVPEEKRRVRRNDLVLLDYADGEAPRRSALLVRRVIALGGDSVDAAGGEIIINQDYTAGDVGTSDLVYPVTVPRGRMFVAGDYRAVSIDSRNRAFGMAAEADVVGRPVAVVWPVFAIGPVK